VTSPRGVTTPTFTVESRHLELRSAVGNARQSWSERHSLLVTIRDGGGRRGFGEATPLEGFGPDTLERARSALGSLTRETLGFALAATTELDAMTPFETLQSPSARFAIDSALLALRARRAGRTFAESLGVLARELGAPPAAAKDEVSSVRPLSTLTKGSGSAVLFDLEKDPEAELRRIRDRESDGRAPTLKIKIGKNLGRELERFQNLLEQLLPGERVRLDANGTLLRTAEMGTSAETPALAGTQFETLLRFIAPALEFIEEPFAELGEPSELGFPLALDETVFRDPGLALRWVVSGKLAVLVLKPMTLGLLETATWSVMAMSHGVEVVFSHCFDGSVAHAHYRTLAKVFGSRRYAMGLGAHPGLALWTEVPS
jgi:L-alanine-DL-glutamate epimerase-like enolase superfamily enzyme